MTSREWSENYDNVLTYANYLTDATSISAKDLLYFFEKPYKVNDEDFEEYIQWRKDEGIEITDKERNEFNEE